MKKMIKKVMAFAFSMTIFAGGASAFGNSSIFTLSPAIEAQAFSVKAIAPGAVYTLGDTIDFGESVYINCDDMNQGGVPMSGTHMLTYNRYWPDYKQHEFYIEGTNNTIYTSSENNAQPWGIQVTGGNGELGNPYTFKVLFFDPTIPRIGNASVTLASDLGLNFYIDNVDEDTYSSYALKFTGNCDEDGQTIQLSTVTVGEETYYYASAHLSADHMSEKINAVIVKDGNEQDISMEFSIMDYLAKAKTDAKVLANPKMLKMVNATETYGAVADYYFNGAALTDTSLPDIDNEFLDRKVSYDILPEGAKVSTVLNAKTKLRLYLEGNTIKGKPDGESTEVYPNELGTPQTVKIGENKYRFSAYTWVYRMLNNTDSSERNKNMAKALYGYVKAAEELAGIPVQSVTVYDPDPEGHDTNGESYDNFTLAARIFPEDATDQKLTWKLDDFYVQTKGGTTLAPEEDTPYCKVYGILDDDSIEIIATAGGVSGSFYLYYFKEEWDIIEGVEPY